jgi:putative intracellular protease/amidase
VLVTNGAAAAAEQANVEVVSPAVGGVDASDGTRVKAGQQIDGAPSVLYDAVVVLASPGGARALAARPAARDFVTDAVAHCKFIGYTGGASVLFEAAGLRGDPGGLDEGFVSLDEYRRRSSSPAAVSAPRSRDRACDAAHTLSRLAALVRAHQLRPSFLTPRR